jgi:hypothetical protein
MKTKAVIFTIVLFTFIDCGDDCEDDLNYVNRGCFNFMVFDTIERKEFLNVRVNSLIG